MNCLREMGKATARRTGRASTAGRFTFRQSGISALEILVVVGISSILAGFTVSRLTAGTYSIDGVATEFKGNFRLARARAVAEGSHYRVRVTSTSAYEFARLLPPTPPATAWTTVDTTMPVRTVTLPNNVRFTNSGYPLTYEFDSRGTMISSSSLTTFTLSAPSRTLSVFLWPSGQVS